MISAGVSGREASRTVDGEDGGVAGGLDGVVGGGGESSEDEDAIALLV